MATQTSATTDIATRLQTYYNPKLLEALDFDLVLASYGMNKGYTIHGTTIRYYRPRAASTTGVGAVTEGTTPSTLASVATGYKEISLSQRAWLSEKITDIVQALDLIKIVPLYISTAGKDLALDLDTVVRNCLITGLLNSNATYTGAYFERFAGVTNTGTSSTDFASLNGASAASSAFTRARHLTMITQLKKARVKPVNGMYVAVVPPSTMHDIRQSTEWVNAATQVNNQALYKRGQIQLDGAIFVENDNAFQEASTYGTYDSTGANWSNIYLGADAFGVPNLNDATAGSSPFKPSMEVVGLKADSNNPLRLWIQIAAKVYYGAAPFITNVSGEVPHYGILRTKSTFA